MKRKVIGTLIILLIFGLLGFFFVAGRLVDQQMNKCLFIEDDDYNISQEALAFHDSLNIADWHSDVLLWDRNILAEATHGHTDVPRLIKGNVTLQVFDAVIKTPKGQNYHANDGSTDNITMLAMANRWPTNTWSNLTNRALHQSHKLHRAAEHSDGKLRIIQSKSELGQLLSDRELNRELVGGMLSIEGLHALEGDVGQLDVLYDAGYRMMGLVHFFDNRVGGSSAGMEKAGLTDFGRTVIRRMDEKGIIIDLAHSSEPLIDDVLALTQQAVVVSHGGVKGTYDSPRNLSDRHLKMIAERGGLIGIGFWDGAVGSPRIEDIVKAMRYTSDLIGIDHVSLGSDWDGGTTTYFDAAHLSALTQGLLNSGFSRAEVRKIMGQNQIDFLLKNLP